jgi:hypothetical protein
MYTIAEIKNLQSNLTLEQIRHKEAKLQKEVNCAWARVFEVIV